MAIIKHYRQSLVFPGRVGFVYCYVSENLKLNSVLKLESFQSTECKYSDC